MNYDLNKLVEQIISNKDFLKLKNVVETVDSYHDHEAVYDHLLKTLGIAKEQISGNFITNPEAKQLYNDFINRDIDGIKNSNVLLLTALLHDIGKILYYKEGGFTQPLIITNSDGTTMCPGHEYLGSTIVREIIRNLALPEKAITQIEKVIECHDAFGGEYFGTKKEWKLQQVVNDIKFRAKGYCKEVLFNIFCDCYTAPIFNDSKNKIVEVFNSPQLYSEREFFIQ
jgi:hypothetical protein